MVIILDTGVLYHPDVLRSLAHLPDEVILPAIAYAERGRQILRDGRALPELDEALDANDIEVRSFGRDEALRFAVHIEDDGTWKAVARDAFVAGHVGDDDVLWTTNPRDFVLVGVPADQILDVTRSPRDPTR